MSVMAHACLRLACRAVIVPVMERVLGPYLRGGGAKAFNFQALSQDLLTTTLEIPFRWGHGARSTELGAGGGGGMRRLPGLGGMRRHGCSFATCTALSHLASPRRQCVRVPVCCADAYTHAIMLRTCLLACCPVAACAVCPPT